MIDSLIPSQHDEILAWFSTKENRHFVEICPEETLRIGLIIKAPSLTDAAFRILVNEHALEVASGRPRSPPSKTIFGRACANFSGTDETESILMKIEHAGTAMADRHREAVDKLLSDDFLDTLGGPEWQELRALDDVIPKVPDPNHGSSMFARVGDDVIMKLIPKTVKQEVQRVLNGRCSPMRTGEIKRAVYTRLNTHQRALLPFVWHYFREHSYARFKQCRKVWETMRSFLTSDFVSGQQTQLLPSVSMWPPSPVDINLFFEGLLDSAFDRLGDYASQFLDSRDSGSVHPVTHDLLLSLNDYEMDFIRQDDGQKSFEMSIPEADFGPVGPGPTFHTGMTEPSLSDLEYGKLASLYGNQIQGDQLGSVVAQDDNSMMHLCKQSSERSSSIPPDSFTDSKMSDEIAGDEYTVSDEHRVRGLILAGTVVEDEDEMGVFVSEEDLMILEDEEGKDFTSDHSTRQMDLIDSYED